MFHLILIRNSVGNDKKKLMKIGINSYNKESNNIWFGFVPRPSLLLTRHTFFRYISGWMFMYNILFVEFDHNNHKASFLFV